MNSVKLPASNIDKVNRQHRLAIYEEIIGQTTAVAQSAELQA